MYFNIGHNSPNMVFVSVYRPNLIFVGRYTTRFGLSTACDVGSVLAFDF